MDYILKQKRINRLLTISLCFLIVFLTICYSLLGQNLTITGTSHIDSNWNVRIKILE